MEPQLQSELGLDAVYQRDIYYVIRFKADI